MTGRSLLHSALAYTDGTISLKDSSDIVQETTGDSQP